MLLKLEEFAPTKLVGEKTAGEGRTCLHLAVLAGDRELLKRLAKHLNKQEFRNEKDSRGDTALHLAVWKYRLDLVDLLLIECKADLTVRNNKKETPLCIAVKFGFLDVVGKFINHEPETVQKLCKEVKILHLAVKLNRIKIVEFLKGKGEIIKELSNQRVDKETVNSAPMVEGDTPLHIAARNKNEPDGRLSNDSKPFMYFAPEVSQEKHKRATDMVDKSFAERRNTELVVAALLATMTFTAVFTVPGGFYSDSNDRNRGTPILLQYYMFKLFIIFDCIAFFLSLFVCIMWQMASELTTEDKMFFMTLKLWIQLLRFYGCSVHHFGT